MNSHLLELTGTQTATPILNQRPQSNEKHFKENWFKKFFQLLSCFRYIHPKISIITLIPLIPLITPNFTIDLPYSSTKTTHTTMLRRGLRLLSTASHDPYNCLISAVQPPLLVKKSGILAGLKYVAKDNICTTELPTTCGSAILSNYTSPFDATVVSQLEEEGLTLVGKGNLDEFGMGLSTMFSHFGASVNPLFVEKRICGGSSGGSAAAVAGGLADFALGTDTGGSVRQPASYCGIVGFKPSYGRLSRYGVVAYGQGFDCVGILANDVATTKKVFNVLNRHDSKDITSMSETTREKVREASRPITGRKLRIGVPEEFLLSEVHQKTIEQVESILHKLIEQGHTVVATSVPSMGRLLSAYYTLATVEAASNISRFDGIRYGKSTSTTDLSSLISGDALIRKNRSAGLGREVQRRLILGNYTLSAESGDNFYRATKLRGKLVQEFNDILSFPNFLTNLPANEAACDVLIGPSASDKAPLMSEYESEVKRNFLNEYVNDVYTVPASMAGLPAISVPCEDRAYGIQVIGQYGDDSTVLNVAQLIESLNSSI